MPFIHPGSGVWSRTKSRLAGTMGWAPKTQLMTDVSGCMSPIHTRRSRLMPSHSSSCMHRCTVSAPMVQMRSSSGSLERKLPTARVLAHQAHCAGGNQLDVAAGVDGVDAHKAEPSGADFGRAAPGHQRDVVVDGVAVDGEGIGHGLADTLAKAHAQTHGLVVGGAADHHAQATMHLAPEVEEHAPLRARHE